MNKFIENIFAKIGFIPKEKGYSGASSGLGSIGAMLGLSDKKEIVQGAFKNIRGWVGAAIRVKAEAVAQIEFRLFRMKKDGTSEELFDHDILTLLNGVNPYQTGYQLKYLTAAHLDLAGGAYWLLDGVKSDTDKPTAIYPLNPKFIEIEIEDQLRGLVKGYKYKVTNSEGKELQPYEVLHIPYPDPDGSPYGRSTYEVAREWIEADDFSTKCNLNYFKNGARLSGTIESDQPLSPEQMQSLRESFTDLYQGAKNFYNVAILPNGAKYNGMGDSPKDMDFANLQQVSRDKILSAFRVPKTVLGVAESETNRATAETANYVFSSRTIKPMMQLIVTYLNEFLVPRFGDDLYLDFADPTPEDRLQQVEEMKAALGGAPAISVNEARENYFAKGPIENGDAVMTSFSFQPLGEPTKKKEYRVEAKGKGPTRTKFAINQDARKKMSAEIVEKVGEAIKSSNNVKFKVALGGRKALAELTDDQFEVIHKAKISRVAPYEKSVKGKVKDFNAKQKEKVLANLSQIVKSVSRKKKDISDGDLFDAAAESNILSSDMMPIYIDLFGTEGKEAARLIGIDDINIINEQTKKLLEKAAQLMSDSYNESTLTLLKDRLNKGINEGMSIDELTAEVSSVYEFSDSVRAETVARTEVFRVANYATRETWKESGVVTTLRFYTAEDERVCDICGPMNGKVMGIDESIGEPGEPLIGANGEQVMVNGSPIKMSDYGDGSVPQDLHVNCRCEVRPDQLATEDAINSSETKSDKDDPANNEEIDADLQDIEKMINE
jgi:HK97 family phage portal protein